MCRIKDRLASLRASSHLWAYLLCCLYFLHFIFIWLLRIYVYFETKWEQHLTSPRLRLVDSCGDLDFCFIVINTTRLLCGAMVSPKELCTFDNFLFFNFPLLYIFRLCELVSSSYLLSFIRFSKSVHTYYVQMDAGKTQSPYHLAPANGLTDFWYAWL